MLNVTEYVQNQNKQESHTQHTLWRLLERNQVAFDNWVGLLTKIFISHDEFGP